MFISALALVIGTMGGVVVAAPVLEFLQQPYGRAFTVLGPTSGVVAYFRVSLVVGAILAVPIITYEILMFLMPGLTRKEKRLVLVSLPAVTGLFLTGIAGKTARKRRPTTTQSDPTHAPAPNLLKRQFEGYARHQVWLSDITYIDTAEGWLYVAAVLDLGSREIVGLALAGHMRSQLTLNALNMPVIQQRPEAGLMHHSDRGSQYTSHDYQQRLRDTGMIASMSRKGNYWDNAPMESFWATLKRECVDRAFCQPFSGSHRHF